VAQARSNQAETLQLAQAARRHRMGVPGRAPARDWESDTDWVCTPSERSKSARGETGTTGGCCGGSVGAVSAGELKCCTLGR